MRKFDVEGEEQPCGDADMESAISEHQSLSRKQDRGITALSFNVTKGVRCNRLKLRAARSINFFIALLHETLYRSFHEVVMEDGDVSDEQFSALEELTAMKTIAEALRALDDGAVRRVLRWANDAFSGKTASMVDISRTEQPQYATNGVPPATARELRPQFDTLADFYAAADPQQDSEKALVVGYWVQVCEGEGDFDGLNVNKKLKDLGHGVSNITVAFNGQIKRRPQLVIQTKKSGTTKQARKLYRLTVEGQRTVERMLQQG